MASADASIVRIYFANAGRPTVIANAFSLVEAELWYHKGKNIFAAKAPLVKSGWVQLDGSSTVLTLDRQELIQCKLTTGDLDLSDVNDPNSLGVVEYLTSKIDRLHGSASIAAKKLRRDIMKFFGAKIRNDLYYWLKELEDVLDIATPDNDEAWAYVRKTERELRKILGKIEVESDRILDRNEKGDWYKFGRIDPSILHNLKIARDQSLLILDEDDQFYYLVKNNTTRGRINKISDALKVVTR